jgi:hypothetical protein
MQKEIVFTNVELAKVFKFLDDLQESGRTNMFGAISWVMKTYPWDKKKADKALSLWMSTYKEGETIDQRVYKAACELGIQEK